MASRTEVALRVSDSSVFPAVFKPLPIAVAWAFVLTAPRIPPEDCSEQARQQDTSLTAECAAGMLAGVGSTFVVDLVTNAAGSCLPLVASAMCLSDPQPCIALFFPLSLFLDFSSF